MISRKDPLQNLYTQAVDVHLQGHFEKALILYQEFLEYDPENTGVLNNIGAIYLHLGDNEKAIEFLKKALQINDNCPDALNNLSSAFRKQKRYGDALHTIQRALSLKSNFAEAHFNLGNLYQEIGNYDKAIDAFIRVTVLNPDHYDAFNNLGSALTLVGRLEEANEAYRTALAIKPNNAKTQYNFARIYMMEGKFEKAIKAFQNVIQLQPNFSSAYLNISTALVKQGKMNSAIDYLNRAIQFDSEVSADAFYNLGLAFELAGDLSNAIKTQKAALDACPDHVASWVGAARVFVRIADWEKVEFLLIKIMNYSFSETESLFLSTALFMFHSVPFPVEDLYKKHCVWGDLTIRQTVSRCPKPVYKFRSRFRKTDKIRVGYVSPDFSRHSVGWFFKHIALNYDTESFDVYCYGTDKREDDLTRDIMGQVSSFKWVQDFESSRTARTIYEDRIQILVDLAGHTRGSRLDVFALKPSPIQVTAFGYPNGTGLETVDYRITDYHAESTTSQPYYREKLVWMPTCFLPLGPLYQAKIDIDREALGLPKDDFLMVSFNRIDKLHPNVLSLWNRLLLRCPNTNLVLACGNGKRNDIKTNILSYFSRHEIKNRVFFLDRVHNEESHRARYVVADLALDTFPYSGTTTSYEALSMNVPVITLVGEHHVQRTTYSILKHLGITETIAFSEDEYLDKAAILVENPELRNSIKAKLSQAFLKLQANGLRDYMENLEGSYRIMWERYQRGETPMEIRL